MSMDFSEQICCFCNDTKLKLLYHELYHPVKRDHGPFDFYECMNCGSGLTIPEPSLQQLGELYKSFDNGLIPAIRTIRENNPLTAWVSQCINHALAYAKIKNGIEDVFEWLDLGAGKGELAAMLSSRFPHAKGWAVDFHGEPQLCSSCKNVNWLSVDLNEANFAGKVEIGKVDMIFSIT